MFKQICSHNNQSIKLHIDQAGGLEKVAEWKVEVWRGPIDFENAFDTVDHGAFRNMLNKSVFLLVLA